jgi:4-amino-4-deoxy-L-arabinose transferase-like glycosyltransferase
VHVTAARRDGLVLAGILVVAAALRLAALPGRGEWDDDQGAQLLTMLRWVRGGQIPDLGPLSSFGTAHHGVAYYWLLAPAAFLTDVDPVAAAATMAVIGVAGVAATWWLGRTVAGPLAGHVAGSLMAISPAAISASTFVWNSNVIGSRSPVRP